MAQPEFPRRLFIKDKEPCPMKSVGYYSGSTTLLDALSKALTTDECIVLQKSKLGVFIKFYELKFSSASRLVHYVLCLQLQCISSYEIWSLIGVNPIRFTLHEFEFQTGLNCEYFNNLESPIVELTDDMARFWDFLGVGQDMGPSSTQACADYREWLSEDHLRLSYLSIYATFIERRKYDMVTRLGLPRLAMDLEAFENYFWGRVALKHLIKSVKEKTPNFRSYHIEVFVQNIYLWMYFAF